MWGGNIFIYNLNFTFKLTTILPLIMTNTQINIKTITIADKTITYQLRKSWRHHYLRITIHPHKGLIVSAPKIILQNQIDQFLRQKQDWIISKLKIRHFHQQKKFKFGYHQSVTILGKDYILKIQKTDNLRPLVEIKSTSIHILMPSKNLPMAEKIFYKWLERFSKQTIITKVEEYAKKFKLKFNRISVKNQQSVWGSCSSKKNLNFSKRLIQLPQWLIDYVVCHELAHLIHYNHSLKFWQQVGEYYPDFKKATRHLKIYQPNTKID